MPLLSEMLNMDWLYTLNNQASNWLWSYRELLVTSWMAVLLVLYGGTINRLLKRIVRPYHYLVRMLSFVVLCTFGYGLLAMYGEQLIGYLAQLIARSWFAALVLATYLLLAFLAERKQQA